MNRYPLLSKTAVIGFLMALLLIPLAMVSDLVQERTAHREHARQEVARSHAGSQTLTGPVLHVPYTETFTRQVVVDVERNIVREETVNEHRVGDGVGLLGARLAIRHIIYAGCNTTRLASLSAPEQLMQHIQHP